MRGIFATLALIGLAILAALAAPAQAQQASQQIALLTAATAQGAGTAVSPGRTAYGSGGGVIANIPHRTFQANGTTSAGAGAATVLIQVSTDGGLNWITACTITLTLATTTSSDGCAMAANWPLVRANVTAISGTGASVNAYMGT